MEIRGVSSWEELKVESQARIVAGILSHPLLLFALSL